MFIKRHLIRSFEAGLHFRRGDFHCILPAGTHWSFDPFLRDRVEIVDMRLPWLVHDKLDVIVKSGVLDGPRHGRGPEGLRARPRLDRRPVQPRAAAGPVRLLDDASATCSRDRGRRGGPLRAPGPAGHRQVAAGRRVLETSPSSSRASRRLVPGRHVRRDAAAGPLRLLEEHRRGQGAAVDVREPIARRGRPGHHDGRQGHAAPQRPGDATAWRTPRLSASVVDDARQALYRETQLAAACRGRRPRARQLPDRQGRRGPGAGAERPPPRAGPWAGGRARSASATSSCRAR